MRRNVAVSVLSKFRGHWHVAAEPSLISTKSMRREIPAASIEEKRCRRNRHRGAWQTKMWSACYLFC